jgi:hypothetical protein
MILPDFILPSRIHQQWQYSGLDSPDDCLDKKHFELYPHNIEYCYNSRGYRDQEWPTELAKLQEAIWCVGDSFTVGLGNPAEHTWPYLLQQHTGRRTINVSMDGASNEWMARKIKRLVEVIAPKTIVVQWSYFARRESSIDHNDEEKRLAHNMLQLSDDADIENFKDCVLKTKQISKNCQIINSIIPDAFPGISLTETRGWWHNDRQSSWPEILPASFADISTDLLEQLKKKSQYNKYFMHYTLQDFIENNNMILVDQYDEFFNKELSRDGHHYGIITATKFVKKLQSKFNLI